LAYGPEATRGGWVDSLAVVVRIDMSVSRAPPAAGFPAS
jgi:hypothetical protein